jgi:hypothetical protein
VASCPFVLSRVEEDGNCGKAESLRLWALEDIGKPCADTMLGFARFMAAEVWSLTNTT